MNNELGSLISRRVKRAENMEYRSVLMSDDAILQRRVYMRQLLLNTSFVNSSNEVLDNLRIDILEDKSMLVEDSVGNQFYIPFNGIKPQEAEFRRIRSMIPFDYMGKTGNDFDWDIYGVDMSDAKETINSFILSFQEFKEKGMGIYIYSKTKGSGKSFLASILLNEVTKRYTADTKFITALDYIELTKKSYNGAVEDLERINNSTVLVIDDIGVQMKKEWVDTVFYQLVNSRYTKQLLTIYTSNLLIEKLGMDDRIIDRIEATTLLVKLPDVSIRQIKSKENKQGFLNQLKQP